MHRKLPHLFEIVTFAVAFPAGGGAEHPLAKIPSSRSTGGPRAGLCSMSVIRDHDGDGHDDLLVNNTNINFHENVVNVPGQFVFHDCGPIDGMRLAGHDPCPAVVYWNGETVPDLLVGAEDNFLYCLESPRTRFAPHTT